MMDILAGLLAHIQSDAEMRGPPGPAGPRGEQGPPGKLPMVKLWVPETVFYTGDVVAYDGGAFQAKRDTGQPPSHADWICLAAARPRRQERRRARHLRRERRVSSSRRRRFQRRQLHRAQGCAWSLPGSRLAAHRQPGQARRSPARRESAALPARGAMRERAARRSGTGRSIARATSRRPS